MRKLYTIVCLVLLGFSVNILAQNTVSLPHVSLVPNPDNPVSIPITVNFSVHPVGSFEIQVEFDENVLEYQGVTGPALSGITSPGLIGTQPVLLTWESGGPDASTFEGDLILLDFIYTGTEGVTNLSFSQTAFEPGHLIPGDDPSWLTDNAPTAAVVTTTFNNGSITYVSPVPLSIWAVLLGIVLIAAFVVTRIYRIV